LTFDWNILSSAAGCRLVVLNGAA